MEKKLDGRDVVARIDSYCGYCKGDVREDDTYCRHCGAKLLKGKVYDGMDSFAKGYAAER